MDPVTIVWLQLAYAGKKKEVENSTLSLIIYLIKTMVGSTG